jgi:hypothetical protein
MASCKALPPVYALFFHLAMFAAVLVRSAKRSRSSGVRL